MNRNKTGIGYVFSERAAQAQYICASGGLMQRRQIRMYREFPIANELTCLLIPGLFGCKHTNLRRVLKKYTQTL
ncbi:MAG: hypothetical protein JXR81_05500 [Candidatus Goldbacteria bacterium]|nr:hypothetical protein [Candidatus Goldiibacteriota bacterium]